MVSIKSSTDLAKMREAGQIAGRALKLAGESIKAGMTTKALDKIIHDFIVGLRSHTVVFKLRRISGQRLHYN